ncbi:MAG: hypothetical protein AAF363_05540 [Bacteroidota bacterium]
MPKRAKKKYPLFLRRRRRLTVLITVFSLFALVLLANFVLSRYTAKVTAEIVASIIEQESKSKYNLSFERIYVDLISKKIVIYGIELELGQQFKDLGKYDEFRNTYALKIPKIEIVLNSVSEIVLYKELDVSSLILTNPLVSIEHFPSDNSEFELSTNTGDLYQVVSGYIKSYRVENFRINNGRANYVNHGRLDRSYDIQDFSFQMENFKLDSSSLANQNKILYTDEILLTINNEQFNLPDSLHQIRFDSLSISTKESSISFHNIRVEPFEELDNIDRRRLLKLNFYDFGIPLFKLTGVDFSTAYNQNKLFIESIFLEEPNIRTDARKKERKTTVGDEDNRLTTILGRLFEEIIISQLEVKNATLNSTFYPRGRKQQFKTKSMSMLLSDLELDSTAASRIEDTFFYDHFEIQLSDYHFILPDSIHKLDIEDLYVSTKEDQIKAKGIHLKPRFTYDSLKMIFKNDHISTFEVESDFVEADGVNIKRFLSSRRLNADNIRISSSAIKILESSKGKTHQESQKMHLYPIIKKTFPSIDINEFKLEKSDLKIVSIENPSTVKGEITDLFLRLSDFSIDSTQHELDSGFFNHFRFETSSKSLKLPLDDGAWILNVEGFNANNNEGLVNFNEAVLKPGKKRSKTELKLGQTFLFGLDFEKALNASLLIQDSISIENPNISLSVNGEKSNDKKKKTPFHIESKKINIKNGQVDLFEDDIQLMNFSKIDLSVIDFQTDFTDTLKLIPLSFGNFDLNIKKSGILEPKLNYILSTEQIHASSNKASFAISNIEVKKNEGDSLFQGLKTDCKLRIPEITVGGLDYFKLLNQNQFESEIFSIPEYALSMNIYPPEGKKSPKDFKEFRMENIKTPFKDLSIDKVLISHGFIDVQFKDNQTFKYYKSEDIDIRLDAVRLGKGGSKKPLFVISDELFVEAYSSNLQLVNAEDSLNIRKLKIDSKKGEILLNGVRVRNESFTGEKQNVYIDGQLDNATVQGLSFEHLLLENQLKFEIAEVNMPSLYLEIDRSIAQLSGQNNEKNKGLAYGFNQIDVGKLSLVNDTLSLVIRDSQTSKSYNLDNTVLSALNINIDSVEKPTVQDVLESSFFQLSVNNFNEYMDDSLYLLSVGSLKMNSQDSIMKIDSIILEPQVGKYEYSRIKNYQTDWIRLEIPYTEFSGVDIISLVENNNLFAESISFFKSDLHVFRDKRVPRKKLDHKKKHPVEILLSLNNTVDVRSINIYDTDITYEEYAVGGYRSGSVLFGGLNADFQNLTNDQNSILTDSIMSVNVETGLMGESQLFVNFQFDLSRPGFHNYQARMDDMNLTNFNKMLEYTDFIKVKSGKMNSLEMSVEANPVYSTGEMYFFYEDLKLQFINKKNYTTKGFGKALEDFFANTFVNSKNPAFLHNRRGEIFYERDSAKSVFNYWSKSAFSGIVSSVGLNKNRKELRQIRKGKYFED